MSEESAPPQGDDLSGLSGFFFYVFIVHPATAWILRPGRFERKKSIMYAISFLALLAAVKTGTLCLLYVYVDIVYVYFAHILCTSYLSPHYTSQYQYYLSQIIRNGNASQRSKSLRSSQC